MDSLKEKEVEYQLLIYSLMRHMRHCYIPLKNFYSSLGICPQPATNRILCTPKYFFFLGWRRILLLCDPVLGKVKPDRIMLCEKVNLLIKY